MFRKLISSVSFSPALIGQLGFYAKRLKKEEATRRAGLIFTVLALVIQSFAVFAPPEPANAASDRDFIKGGVSSISEYLKHYDKNDHNLRDMMNYTGITRAEIAKAKKTTVNSKDGWLSWGRTSPFSASQGDVVHYYKKSNGDTGKMHSKPIRLWDTTAYSKKYGSKYVVFEGTSKKLGKFSIMLACGNVMTKKLPAKTPAEPSRPTPSASCTDLEIIRVNDTQRRFKASAKTGGSATISSYAFNIKNTSGSTVKTFSYKSSSSAITTGNITLPPGQYAAQATVITSAGTKTSSNCKVSFTIDTPGISITKTVNNQKRISVSINEPFTYTISVKNTGKTTLQNVEVSDNAPSKIAFLSASAGSLSENGWKYTISSLAPGKSTSYSIRAKATERANSGSTITKNIACVNTSSIAGSPDACDEASVVLPETLIKVCNLATDKIVEIRQSELTDTGYSKDLAACTKIQVCDTISGAIVTIRTPELDKSAQSTDLSLCDDMRICDLQTAQVTVIKRSQFNKQRHSQDASDCVPAVVASKTGLNLTQDNKNATSIAAQPNDRIQYTITMNNIGDVSAPATFKENLQDVLEYAKIIDNGGGSFDTDNKTLTWATTELAPGESKSRLFVVQLSSTIPAGARGTSDPSSYDCIMTNSFGNTIDIAVACPNQKLVEQTVSELPTTGPGQNMLFAGILLAVVSFFYARSRQLSREVKYIRRDLNSGTL